MRIDIDKMMSLEKMREIDPLLKDKSDEELIKARETMYGLGQLFLEDYFDRKEKKEL